MVNRLTDSTSPYLLQHQHNPVDWFPWSEEAWQKARDEDKPVFLSVGYSACHWCHVMERESFENEQIASFLNDHFISIKVDREERPDLDQIYMHAVQVLSGHGGWPMSVFLTPEQKPFYAGTYFPPENRMNMPGFLEVLQAIRRAWVAQREQLDHQAAELTGAIQQGLAGPRDASDASPDVSLLTGAADQLERVFDHAHGGFGNAPKFPHAMDDQLLMRVWRRTGREALWDMVQLHLDKMARGGIYDHLGGGFARYSVDARWLVPHFEKMLYDNALLARTYTEAFQVRGRAGDEAVARQTLDYVLRDMTHPAGGFFSAEDADSEGVEGKFYVWSQEEVRDILGEEAADTFADVYDVTEAGNFEGANILHLARPIAQCAAERGQDPETLEAELAQSRQRLFEARGHRVRPGLDDKVLVGWNALMIDALAFASAVFQEPRYADAAAQAARFLDEAMRQEDGRLLHTWRDGRAQLPAYLDDYACLANALVTLYEVTFQESWIDIGLALAETMTARFANPEGGFFYTADDHEQLVARTVDFQDSSVPSGNAMAAQALLRLGKLTGRSDLVDAAAATLERFAGVMQSHPGAVSQMLIAADLFLGPTYEIVVTGAPGEGIAAEALRGFHGRFIPRRVLACRRPDEPEPSNALDGLFEGKSGDPPRIFVCRDHACEAPVDAGEAESLWDRLESAGNDQGSDAD